MKLKIAELEKIISEYKKHQEYINSHSTPTIGLTQASEIDYSVIDNPYMHKLKDLINTLAPDERAELKALMWIGKTGEEFDFETLKRHGMKIASDDDADYIISKKNLDQLLMKGVEKLQGKTK